MKENKIPIYQMPYEVNRNQLFKWVASGKTSKMILLCNFLPYLASENIYDNGAEEKRTITIGAINENGKQLPHIELSVSEFESMNWITEKWGSKCNVEAGRVIKEHIRHAIQTTAEDIKPETIYSHSGWRKIDGKLKFLLNGMEISCETGDSTLKNYHFQMTTQENKISTSYELLKSDLAPKEILYPLIAFQYLAPLCHLLNIAGYMPKTVLVLVGRTGSKKSTMAALMLSHFGNFTHSTLPLTFRDTGNSVVERLFVSKDLPTVIDDFHPTTGGYEETAMLKTFQLIMRAFGDGTARVSLNQRRELKESKPPRGIGMVTAEYSPSISESGIARCLEINVSPTDVNMDLLSSWQERARLGGLGCSMKSYILWLESLIDTEEKQKKFVAELKIVFETMREMMRDKLLSSKIKFHDRVPEACAYLLTAFEYFTMFLLEKEIINQDEVNILCNEIFEITVSIAETQSKAVQSISVAEQFVQMVSTMISNEIVCVPKKQNYFSNTNECIGFQDDDFYYLNMTITLKLVRKFCLEQGEMMPPKLNPLLQQLDEDEYWIIVNSLDTKVREN